MPHYRFLLTGSGERHPRAEEYGIFNDQGAIQFARRFAHNGTVEIWDRERLVGRVENAQPVMAD